MNNHKAQIRTHKTIINPPLPALTQTYKKIKNRPMVLDNFQTQPLGV